MADRVAQALGLAEPFHPAEELFWGIRRFFETMARRSPLVVVFDDVHWAEATFLDLIEHVCRLAYGAPMLLLCLARPEFLDGRPTWAGGLPNATSVLLETLTDEQGAELVRNLLGQARLAAEAHAEIARLAGGNPLFVEQMLALLIDEGAVPGRDSSPAATQDPFVLSTPPTIAALLAARLDRLDDQEQAVLERAAVAGTEFEAAAVAELSPAGDPARVTAVLMSLTRKHLIRPGHPRLAGPEAFEFRHVLIRDAAYARLPTPERAALHERYAGWL
jgi:predicted ATPase